MAVLRAAVIATIIGSTFIIACSRRPSASQTSESVPLTVGPGTQGPFIVPFSESSRGLAMVRSAAGDSLPRVLMRMEIGMKPMDGDSALLTRRWAPPDSFARASHFTGDSLVIRRRSLAPVTERLIARGAIREFHYDGFRVTGTITPADSAPRKFERTFPEAPFAFNEAELLVRSMTLGAGHSIVVPLFSEMDEVVEHDTITVVGPARVNGHDGWRVRFADPAIVANYVVDGDSREILTHELIQRKTGTRLRFVAVDAEGAEPRNHPPIENAAPS